MRSGDPQSVSGCPGGSSSARPFTRCWATRPTPPGCDIQRQSSIGGFEGVIRGASCCAEQPVDGCRCYTCGCWGMGVETVGGGDSGVGMAGGLQDAAASGDGVVIALAASRPGSAAKRIIDVLVGTVALVVLSPLLLTAAVCVKLTCPGPVFYRQRRVGRGGERFEVVKFRTMRVGTHEEVLADPASRAAYESNGWKLDRDDPNITRAGRWLCRTSLDELDRSYVERWSLWGDVMLLARAPAAVLNVSHAH